MARTTDPTSDASEASTAELMSRLSADGSQLVRDEIALAKLELGQKAKQVGLGAGLFGAAGVLAAYGFGTLLAAIVLALALVLPAWAAALIVAAVLFIGAGAAALHGRAKVNDGTPPMPESAIENVKADIAAVQEARHHEH
jgi:uncharacterized membrane protein YqjE